MVHFFDADIAKKYGVNAAVLACFLWKCIEQKSAESPQLHEGKVWVRCSVQMMTGFFPFLSYDEIRYALKQLVKERVLTKGRFNESRFDRTNWYAFTEFGQFLMAESEGRTKRCTADTSFGATTLTTTTGGRTWRNNTPTSPKPSVWS